LTTCRATCLQALQNMKFNSNGSQTAESVAAVRLALQECDGLMQRQPRIAAARFHEAGDSLEHGQHTIKDGMNGSSLTGGCTRKRHSGSPTRRFIDLPVHLDKARESSTARKLLSHSLSPERASAQPISICRLPGKEDGRPNQDMARAALCSSSAGAEYVCFASYGHRFQ
jgi:hypothetical protein